MGGAKFWRASLGLFLAGMAIADCGGKIDASSTGSLDVSVPPPMPTVLMPSFDAGPPTSLGLDGGAPAFPSVANGPSDTSPACASRVPFECACSGEDCPPVDSYFAQLAVACAASAPACGYVYADFDSDGCATALRMVQPDPKFIACVTAQLDIDRWLCVSGGGELEAFLDCTTPER